MSAVLANDSDDLEALFDSIATEHKNAQAAKAASQSSVTPLAPSPVNAPVQSQGGDGALLTKLGQLTRTLHESLRDLGYDRLVEQAASSIPDARERLTYVATMTERAAERVLNATDAARPLQDQMSSSATQLAADWRKVYAGEMNVEQFKSLAGSTVAFLEGVPEQTKATNTQLMEIVMAQDFQDLTGQVIKRINELAHHFEQQLLKLLIESTPEGQRPPGSEGLLNGPVVNPDRAGDVAHTQAQVDDLLESLGF
ncbi:MAG: protein phosphatase CheZ [Betaproteobacteria bacterium]|nr:protein phosphatase CheZ [Betaproteobacteria bacterium]